MKKIERLDDIYNNDYCRVLAPDLDELEKQAERALTFPRENNSNLGWIISYNYLKTIEEITDSAGDGILIGLEEIEIVLLAVEQIEAGEK